MGAQAGVVSRGVTTPASTRVRWTVSRGVTVPIPSEGTCHGSDTTAGTLPKSPKRAHRQTSADGRQAKKGRRKTIQAHSRSRRSEHIGSSCTGTWSHSPGSRSEQNGQNITLARHGPRRPGQGGQGAARSARGNVVARPSQQNASGSRRISRQQARRRAGWPRADSITSLGSQTEGLRPVN